MEFLCFSDTHGQPPPPGLAGMPGKYLLHAGDIYDRLSYGMLPTSPDDFCQWMESGKELCAVRGNHDTLDPDGIFGSSDITGAVRKINPGLYLVGIGWHGERFYELPRECDLAPVCKSVFRQAMFMIPNKAHTVILTHYPALMPKLFPTQGDPEGWMFECIAQAVETFRPIAVVQGHVHELFGAVKEKNGTLIVFPGPKGGVLDVDVKDARASFRSLS